MIAKGSGPAVVIVGGGIAGAGLGCALAGRARVILLEREGAVRLSRDRALGRELHRNLRHARHPQARHRQPRVLGRVARRLCGIADPHAAWHRHHRPARPVGRPGRNAGGRPRPWRRACGRSTPAEVVRQVPILRPGYVAGAVIEPGAMDIDVHGLHSGYLAGLRAAGGRVVTGAAVVGIDRADGWRVRTQDGQQFAADILVNAAGAWADEVAALAGVPGMSLQPRRRTALTIDMPVSVSGWPLVDDVAGDFYFKADAGALFVSPADATPSPPADAQPEELDIAIAIDRLQQATTLAVTRVRRAWAGLRTFAPDGDPVVGRDARVDSFVWLAGQGGYGIKTSPALSRIAAAAILREAFPPDLAALGLSEASLSPARLRQPEYAR